jgi:hypothetical protein
MDAKVQLQFAAGQSDSIVAGYYAPDAVVLMSDHGNYVTTFVKRNGQWRSLHDVAVSEVPAAPAPPPAKKK